ncbi:MAG: adenylate/guanylate cyclase domain-containing protein [Desulfovibrionaceae bacterium]
MKKFLPSLLIVTALAMAATVAVRHAVGFALPDRCYGDLWHQLAGQRAAATHAAIVSIGDQDIARYQNDPLVFWGPHFAQAIAALRQAGVSGIGIDVLFTINAGAWLRKLDIPQGDASRTFDIAMREQLASGAVVLAGLVVAGEDGQPSVLRPTPDYLYALPGQQRDVGLTNLHTDPDGVVRRFMPAYWNDRGERLGIAFPMLLALRAKGSGVADGMWPIGAETLSSRQFPITLGYLGPPGTVPRVPFASLLAPDAANDPAVRGLAGKIVIIAVEPSGMQDVHLTPYSTGLGKPAATLMKGAEVQATIIETILTGHRPLPCPAWSETALVLACVVGMAAIVLTTSLSRAGGIALGLCAGCAAVSYAFFLWGNLMLPPAQAQAGVLAAFLGGLCKRLSGEERRRVWLQQTFGKYVAKDVVDQLLAGRCAPDLGGELRDATILFSDIRNFTTISEQLAPQEVMEMLNAYFDRACERIMARGGAVDKFIGDAVMAVFGSPCPNPDHARQAVAAALDLAAEAQAFGAWMTDRFGDKNLPPFAVGVGLHSGNVMVGNVGAHNRLEFTALGDTVNLASRLEGATKPLGWRIAASRATVDAAGADVATGRSETITVKGRREPVEAVEIVGIKEKKT